MKNTYLKSLLLIFFFLATNKNFAQSFISASENITIKIVKKISITVNDELKERCGRVCSNGIIKATNRNLLISYNDIKGNSNNTYLQLYLHAKSVNSTLTIGKQTELKHLAEDEHLHINIDKQKELKTINSKYFVTVVY